MNKIVVYTFIFMVVCSSVVAITTRTNTTVTLDYVGNDMFYLRTENTDYLYNTTDQTDKTVQIEIVRQTADNLTDYEHIMQAVLDVNKTCFSLSTDYNFSTQYANSKSAFDNCSTSLTTCRNEYDVYKTHLNLCEASQTSWSGNYSALLQQKMQIEQQKMLVDINYAQAYTNYNNCTQEYTNFKSTSTSGFGNGFFVGCTVAGVISLFAFQRYKKKDRPTEMRKFSQTGQ